MLPRRKYETIRAGRADTMPLSPGRPRRGESGPGQRHGVAWRHRTRLSLRARRQSVGDGWHHRGDRQPAVCSITSGKQIRGVFQRLHTLVGIAFRDFRSRAIQIGLDQPLDPG